MKKIYTDLFLAIKNNFLSWEEKYLFANKTHVLGSLEMCVIVLAPLLKNHKEEIEESDMTYLKSILSRLDSNSRKYLPFTDKFWSAIDEILGA